MLYVNNQLNAILDLLSFVIGTLLDISYHTDNLAFIKAILNNNLQSQQGRGFAVVTEEVRKLAEQSAGAAKEIVHLINGIQAESQRTMVTMTEDAHIGLTKKIRQMGAQTHLP